MQHVSSFSCVGLCWHVFLMAVHQHNTKACFAMPKREKRVSVCCAFLNLPGAIGAPPGECLQGGGGESRLASTPAPPRPAPPPAPPYLRHTRQSAMSSSSSAAPSTAPTTIATVRIPAARCNKSINQSINQSISQRNNRSTPI